jgi:hypothetical protein
MTEDNDLGEEYLACQNDKQKVYVLNDAEAVDQLIRNLSPGGKGGLSQKRLLRKFDSGRDDQQQDDMLLEMNARLQALIGNTAGEQLLSEENLAFENGEQKVYILPDLTAVEQLRRGVTSKSGEASKSRMWERATPVADNGQEAVTGLASRLQVVEAKLQRLEGLINSSGIPNANGDS